jgi:hypothetical protein
MEALLSYRPRICEYNKFSIFIYFLIILLLYETVSSTAQNYVTLITSDTTDNAVKSRKTYKKGNTNDQEL